MGFLWDSITTILAALVATFVTKILAEKWKDKRKRYHPVVGTAFHLITHFRRLHHYMTDLASKHKTYRILSLVRSEVYTADPVNVEYILRTNFANYAKGHYNYDILGDLLGDGIFTVDGEKWRQQRKLSIHEFSTKNLRGFSSSVFRNVAGKLGRLVSEAANSNQIIEIQDMFMKSTMDSVFKVILGAELDTLYGTNEECIQFVKSFDEANAITMYRFFDIFWKIKKFLNIGLEAKLKDSIEVVHQYVNKEIGRKMEQANELQDESQSHERQMKRRDILSRFIELKETDPKYLRDVILSFIIAGKDTTSSTLSWFLYMLCKHPLVQEQVAGEVREAAKMKPNSTLEEIAASITEEALDKMQYLHAALTETLRLYPSVPLDMKLCLSDDTLPDGFSVRKGDIVGYQPYAMGRMKYLWGEDAEEFRPERWLDENGIFKAESSFKFTAFQAGPRMCMGKEFAYRQMKIFMAVLLGCFVFKLSDENKEANYRTMLTLQVDGGLHLRVSPRSWNQTSI